MAIDYVQIFPILAGPSAESNGKSWVFHLLFDKK